jgi:hypothetical protein
MTQTQQNVQQKNVTGNGNQVQFSVQTNRNIQKSEEYTVNVSSNLQSARTALTTINRQISNQLAKHGTSGILETLHATKSAQGFSGALQQLERITQRFIFAAGTEGACWMKYDVNDSDTGWSGWLTCGGQITDAPRWHCSYDQPGNVLTMNVYARGANQGTSDSPVYHLYWLQVDALNPIYTNPDSGNKYVIKLVDWQSLGGNILY